MKKILIITYYWPPAGGPGVQRWLKFVKYLPDFGFQPIIYTPENPTYQMRDENLLSEIPENLQILRTPITEPYKFAEIFSKKHTQTISSGIIAEQDKQGALQKFLLYIRGNFFVPDARILWKKPSVKFLKEFLLREKIETVITTGPPNSMHLIAMELKKTLPIKWVADFRDPWTKMWYFDQLKLTNQTRKKHEKLEQQVLQTADQVITTTKTVQQEFRQLTDKPVHVITNGYDLSPASEKKRDSVFSLSHIGSFFSLKNLSGLWQAIRELIDENDDFKKLFKLRLIGKNNPELTAELKRYDLWNHTEDLGYLSHSEVIEQQEKSSVLLIQYTHEEIKGIIPGKLFEYMRAGRPILGVGPKNWEVKKIIDETQTGHCFSFEEKDAIKSVLKTYFDAYLKDDLQIEPVGIQQYHRRNLTGKLAELLR